VITVELQGLDELLESIRNIPTSIDRQAVFEDVAQRFSARLRAATPKGYSGKLRDSVIYSADGEQGEAGYEAGVETAGDASLDSVIKPKKRSKSVLARNWVRPSELEAVLQETFDAYASEGSVYMESRFAEELSRGLS
jgi:hypothetical protein